MQQLLRWQDIKASDDQYAKIQVAVRRHDTNSHMGHMPEAGHVVDFKKAKVQAQALLKGSRIV